MFNNCYTAILHFDPHSVEVFQITKIKSAKNHKQKPRYSRNQRKVRRAFVFVEKLGVKRSCRRIICYLHLLSACAAIKFALDYFYG
jgi:hypothetical protein